MNADDYLKKKTTILANAEKGKDINIDIFMPKVTEVTISDFAKYLQKAIEMQRLKLKLLEKEIKINSIDARIQQKIE